MLTAYWIKDNFEVLNMRIKYRGPYHSTYHSAFNYLEKPQ